MSSLSTDSSASTLATWTAVIAPIVGLWAAAGRW